MSKMSIRLTALASIVAFNFGSSASANPKDKTKPETPPIAVPSVTSTGQQSGVTAGYVNNIQVMPTLVRGPQLENLKNIFINGARIMRTYSNAGLSDVQIDQIVGETDSWVNSTFSWLNDHVSSYAAERFAFRPPGLTFNYTLSGDHAPGYAEKRGNALKALSEYLNNLDQLMRDPSIYPEK